MLLTHALRAASTTDNVIFISSVFAENVQTVNLPSTVLAGDLVIILNTALSSSGTAPTSTTPTGFTLINSSTSSVGLLGRRTNFSFRTLAVSGAQSVTNLMNGSFDEYATVIIFRYASTPTAQNFQTSATSGTPTSLTLSASSPTVVSGKALAFFGCFSGSGGTFTYTTPAGFSDAYRSDNTKWFWSQTLTPSNIAFAAMPDAGSNNIQFCFYMDIL